MASKVGSMEPIEPGASVSKGASATNAPAPTRAPLSGAHTDDAILPAAEITPAVPTQPATLSLPEEEVPDPSPFLRAWRFLGGVGALLVAWAAAVAVYLLVTNAQVTLGHFEIVPLRAVVGIVGVLVVVWLAVAFFACAVAGAYCLLLAITRRRW